MAMVSRASEVAAAADVCCALDASAKAIRCVRVASARMGLATW